MFPSPNVPNQSPMQGRGRYRSGMFQHRGNFPAGNPPESNIRYPGGHKPFEAPVRGRMPAPWTPVDHTDANAGANGSANAVANGIGSIAPATPQNGRMAAPWEAQSQQQAQQAAKGVPGFQPQQPAQQAAQGVQQAQQQAAQGASGLQQFQAQQQALAQSAQQAHQQPQTGVPGFQSQQAAQQAAQQRMPAPWTPQQTDGARPTYSGMAPGGGQRAAISAPQQPGSPMTMRQQAQGQRNQQNHTF